MIFFFAYSDLQEKFGKFSDASVFSVGNMMKTNELTAFEAEGFSGPSAKSDLGSLSKRSRAGLLAMTLLDRYRRLSLLFVGLLVFGVFLSLVLTNRTAQLKSLLRLSVVHDQDVRQALIETLDGRRFLEPRLSGFDAYAPCTPEERGVDQRAAGEVVRCLPSLPVGADQEIFERLSGLENQLRDAESNQEATSYWTGLWHLYWAKESVDLDQALKALHKARQLSPGDAEIKNDLAATLLLKADIDGPHFLLPALEIADEALHTNPDLGSALFNRALALSRLGLAVAESAWTSFIDLESDPEWIEEAAERQRALAKPEPSWKDASFDFTGQLIDSSERNLRKWFRKSPEEFQKKAEMESFVIWAQEQRQGTVDADKLSELLVKIGQAVKDKVGERVILDAALAIADAPKEARARLAKAHLLFAEAEELYRERVEIARAGQLFAQASSLFAGTHSSFLYRSRYQEALCAYFERDLNSALEQLTILRQRLPETGYSNSLAHVDWMTGLIHISRGEFSAGIEDYRSAIRHFDNIDFQGTAAFLRVLLADALQRIGEFEGAWEVLHPSLQKAGLLSELHRKSIYETAARIATEGGYPRAGIYFQDQALKIARGDTSPVAISEALHTRAAIRDRAGLSSEAEQDLQEARNWLASITDPSMYRMVEAGIAQTEGRILGQSQILEGIEPLTSSIAYFAESGNEVFLPSLHLDRARLYLNRGEVESAEVDLLQSIRIAESQRQGLSEAEWRVSFWLTVHDALTQTLH